MIDISGIKHFEYYREGAGAGTLESIEFQHEVDDIHYFWV